jgi:hypothetical protein
LVDEGAREGGGLDAAAPGAATVLARQARQAAAGELAAASAWTDALRRTRCVTLQHTVRKKRLLRDTPPAQAHMGTSDSRTGRRDAIRSALVCSSAGGVRVHARGPAAAACCAPVASPGETKAMMMSGQASRALAPQAEPRGSAARARGALQHAWCVVRGRCAAVPRVRPLAEHGAYS